MHITATPHLSHLSIILKLLIASPLNLTVFKQDIQNLIIFTCWLTAKLCSINNHIKSNLLKIRNVLEIRITDIKCNSRFGSLHSLHLYDEIITHALWIYQCIYECKNAIYYVAQSGLVCRAFKMITIIPLTSLSISWIQHYCKSTFTLPRLYPFIQYPFLFTGLIIEPCEKCCKKVIILDDEEFYIE